MLQNSSVGGPAEKGSLSGNPVKRSEHFCLEIYPVSQTKVRVPGAQSALKRLVKTSLDEQKSLLRTMIETTIMKVRRQVELGCHFATSTAWVDVARRAANPWASKSGETH